MSDEITFAQKLILNNYSASALKRSYGSVKVLSLLSDMKFEQILKDLALEEGIEIKYSNLSHNEQEPHSAMVL